MVGSGVEPLFPKERGGFLDLLARGTVDDPRFPGVPVEKGQQLGVEVLLGQDVVKQVGPVEGGPDQPRIAQAEPGEDVLFHGGGGGRRERRDRTVREPLHKAGQGQIVRAEVVSPLRNAVGFVDGEKRDGTRGEGFPEAGHAEPFRGHV